MQDFVFTSAHLPLTPVRASELKRSEAHSQTSGHSTSAEALPGRKEANLAARREDRIQRRHRKTPKQLEVLIAAFHKGRIWATEDVKFLSAQTNLKTNQIIKWRWDYDQKLRKEEREASQLLHCTETLQPLPIATALQRLREYYDYETRDISQSPTRLLALPRAINNCIILPH